MIRAKIENTIRETDSVSFLSSSCAGIIVSCNSSASSEVGVNSAEVTYFSALAMIVSVLFLIEVVSKVLAMRSAAVRSTIVLRNDTAVENRFLGDGVISVGLFWRLRS